jgi:hypothetical protein
VFLSIIFHPVRQNNYHSNFINEKLRQKEVPVLVLNKATSESCMSMEQERLPNFYCLKSQAQEQTLL